MFKRAIVFEINLKKYTEEEIASQIPSTFFPVFVALAND
jgi:hypothetical protein